MTLLPATLPVVFIPHGGGPWPFVDTGLPTDEVEGLATYLRSVSKVPDVRPSALLVISAHWEAARPTIMTAARPHIDYDYYGFPPESYTITWPAPGDATLAARVSSLLGDAGFQPAADATRGFDHGAFIPLKLVYPDADIPAIQLSLLAGLDAGQHLEMGRALMPLRDEGVFIIASGMTFHNVRALFGAGVTAQAEAFDAWLRETMRHEPMERNRRLQHWTEAPGARSAHPREEHLIPLMVAAGAAGPSAAVLAYSGTFAGHRHSAFHFGVNSSPGVSTIQNISHLGQ